MLFFGLLALLAVYAGYLLSVAILDVVSMDYWDEWTVIWVSIMGAEIVVSSWFLMRCVRVIGWNVHAMFGTSLNFITHFLSALA